MENIKLKTASSGSCEVVVDVDVPVDMLKEEADLVFSQIQAGARIPGFRQGKAPMNMVRQTFSNEAKSELIKKLSSRAVSLIIEKENIKMITMPVLEDLRFDLDKEMKFKLRFEKMPEFVLKPYKKMKLEKLQKEASDSDVEKEIKVLQERNAVLQPVQDDTAGKNHVCQVDFVGKIDGAEIKDLSMKNQTLDLGAEHILPGFTDGIAGMKKSETKDIEVDFPAGHMLKNYAGKKAVFTVILNEIKEKKLPQADDEFAKDLGYKSIIELRELILKHLKAQFESDVRRDLKDQINDELLKANKFDVPKSLVLRQMEDMLSSAKTQMRRRGGFSDKDWEESLPALREKYMPAAEESVRLFYITDKIIETEKITATEEEYNKHVEALKAYARMDENDFNKFTEQKREEIMDYLKKEKMFDLLIGNAKIKIKK